MNFYTIAKKNVLLLTENVCPLSIAPQKTVQNIKRGFFVNYSHILIVANISFITKYLKYLPILLLISRIKFKVGKSRNISGYNCGFLEFFWTVSLCFHISLTVPYLVRQQQQQQQQHRLQLWIYFEQCRCSSIFL